MNTKTVYPTGGVSASGLLGVVFVTLKLCGVINWSWWWVTLPFWGGLVLAVAVIVLSLVLAGITMVAGHFLNHKRKQR